MISVLEKDYRCLAAANVRWVICRCFKKYQQKVIKAIIDCTLDKDDRLLQAAGYLIAELFMIYDTFADYINEPAIIDKDLKRHIIKMLMLYREIDKYREKAQNVLCIIAAEENGNDNEILWAEMFSDDKIDIERDSRFALCVLQSIKSTVLIEEFNKYIVRHHCTRKFNKLLLDMCKKVISGGLDLISKWGFEDSLAKIIISLYYNNAEATTMEQKEIVNECLDIWDLMYEKDFGTARQLTSKLLEI